MAAIGNSASLKETRPPIVPADPKKLHFIDSLRGLAILLVLLVHSGGLIELFGAKLALANFGQRGVQLFYEVSAFSLLYSYFSRREGSWRAFFIRRFFRIAPLFYLSIAANFIYTVFILKLPPLSPMSYAAGFLFLFGFHPSTINAVAPAGWSVAVEATFYALFPIMALTIRNLGSAIAFAASSVLVCFLVCYRVDMSPITALPAEYRYFLWFPVEFPVFCFGFVAFFLWRDLLADNQGGPAFRPILNRRLVQPAASIAFLLLACWTIYVSFPVSNYRLYLNSLSFIFLILALGVHPWKLLVNPATRFIGRMSFSIYLVHPYLSPFVSSVIDGVERRYAIHLYGHYTGLALTFGTYLAGSLLISLVTFPLVEQRGITLGKRLISRMRGMGPEKPEASNSQMETQTEIKRLRAKLRTSYALGAISLLAVFLTISVYDKANPESVDKSTAEYRKEIGEYQGQIETLSADLLQNQRALKNTEKELQKAIDAIKQLQGAPRA
jgi:peptidoglycan/LPS O-acetylase OafA/YrhL